MKSTILPILAISFSASTALAGWSYRIQPLATISGDQIDLAGSNDQDQIIGQAISRNPFNSTAEIWKNGSVNPIPLPGGSTQGGANGINGSGTVVGDFAAADGSEYSYVWNGKSVIKMPKLPGYTESYASDVNDFGEIVGSLASVGHAQATVWKNMKPTVLDVAKDAVFSSASSVNDRGDVVGNYQNAANTSRAFIDVRGKISTLPSLGGVLDEAFDINQRDQAIGESLVGNQYFAVLWQNGTIQKLPALPGSSSARTDAINNAGQVVGTSFEEEGRATLWNDGTPTDLNTLLPSNSGWILHTADAINNRGQIIGEGNFNGVAKPFLLTPVGSNSVPLPSPLLIGATTFPLAMLASWMFCDRRRRSKLES